MIGPLCWFWLSCSHSGLSFPERKKKLCSTPLPWLIKFNTSARGSFLDAAHDNGSPATKIVIQRYVVLCVSWMEAFHWLFSSSALSWLANWREILGWLHTKPAEPARFERLARCWYWACKFRISLQIEPTSQILKQDQPAFSNKNVYVYQSIYLSNYLSIYLSIYPSIDLSIYGSIYLSIHPSIYLFACLSVCLSVCVSVHVQCIVLLAVWWHCEAVRIQTWLFTTAQTSTATKQSKRPRAKVSHSCHSTGRCLYIIYMPILCLIVSYCFILFRVH